MARIEGGPTIPAPIPTTEKAANRATKSETPSGGSAEIKDSFETAKRGNDVFGGGGGLLPTGLPSLGENRAPAVPQWAGNPGDVRGAQPMDGSGVFALGEGDQQAIPPTTLKAYAYDKVADKITDKLKDLKPNLDREVHPKLSDEQQAFHDAGLGVAKVKEYVEYAQVAAEMLKHAPDGATRQKIEAALKKAGGDLESLSGKLEGMAKTLGKVAGYASLAKDAIGAVDAARDLVANIPKDFGDRKAVAKFTESLGKASDAAQSFFARGRDALLAAGKSGAGVTLSFFTGMLSIGVDGVKAGVGNVNKYIDRLQDVESQIARGGVAKKLPPMPDPPAKVQTYGDLRFQEFQDKGNQVRNAVTHAFGEGRAEIKAEFQAKHKEVRGQFDKQEFPKMMRESRAEIVKELRALVDQVKKGNAPIPGRLNDGTAKAAADTIDFLKGKISRVESGDISDPVAFMKGVAKDLPPLASLEKLEKRHQVGLDKHFEKNGLGEGALEKEYAAQKLSRADEQKRVEAKLRELKLDGQSWKG